MRSPADVPLVNPEPDRRRDSVLIAVSYLVSSLSGAGVALILGLAGGAQARTDGVLAAYSLYAVVVLLAAVARTTLVPLFGPSSDVAGYRRLATAAGSRAALLGLVAGVAVIVTAPLTGRLLAGQLPGSAQRAAVVTLVLLGPAVALQARGAVGSAILAGANRFAASAWIYTAGAMLTLAAAVSLVPTVGAVGAPIAVLCGATLIALAHERQLQRLGLGLRVRPRWLGEREQWRLAGGLLSVSALQLAVQAALAICVANLAGVTGDVTRYTYAYFATIMIVSATSGASSLVALPSLIEQLHRGERTAVSGYLRAAGVPALALVVPAVAGLVAFGRPLLGIVLESTFTSAQLDQLYALCLLLAPLAPLYALLAVLQGVGTAEGRRRQFVVAAAAGTLATLAGALVWRGHTEAVAGVHVGAAAILTTVTARSVLGAGAWRMLGDLARRTLPGVALCLPFAAGGVLVGEHGSGLSAAAAGAACLALYLVAGARWWPGVLGRFPVLRRLAPQPRRAASARS